MARPVKSRKPASKSAQPALELVLEQIPEQASMNTVEENVSSAKAPQNGASEKPSPTAKAKSAKKATKTKSKGAPSTVETAPESVQKIPSETPQTISQESPKSLSKLASKPDAKAETKQDAKQQSKPHGKHDVAKQNPPKQNAVKQDTPKQDIPAQSIGKQNPPKQDSLPQAKVQAEANNEQKAEQKSEVKQDAKPEQKQQPKPTNEPPLPLAEFLVKKHGIVNTANVFANLGTANLYEHILFLREGTISAQGAVVVDTKPHQNLLTDHVLVVRESVNEEYIAWNNSHRAFDQAKFNTLKTRITAYLQGKSIYVQDCFVGSDNRLRLPFRIITEHAYQSLAARNLFIEAQAHELKGFDPRMTILSVPNFKAVPELDGTDGEAFAIIDFSQRLAIIGGTKHIGEIKNLAFTVMSYAMPLRKVLPLHAAASLGSGADSILLLGNSGAGKTALALDATRQMIGDDAHAWGDEGIFNLESGTFARISGIPSDTPTLLSAMTRTFGAVVENVQIDAQTRTIAFPQTSAFAALPRTAMSNEAAIAPKNRGGHPKHVIILVNDALGVLPPVARLSHEQAVFFFLAGYHSITPNGEGKEKSPEVRFNPCFAESQMLEDPLVYANLFREKLRRNRTNTWLVNTGYQGDNAQSSARIKQEQSKAVLNAIINGALQSVEYSLDETFGLQVPSVCQGIPTPMLNPRNAWKDGAKFEKTAQSLIKEMNEHLKQFAENFDASIADALNPAAQQALQQSSQQNQQQSQQQKPQQQGKKPPQAHQSPKGSPQQRGTPPSQEENEQPIILNESASNLEDMNDLVSDDSSAEPIPSGLFADAPEFAPEFRPTLESALDAALEGDGDSEMIAESYDDANIISSTSQPASKNAQAQARPWKGGGGNRFRGGRDGNARGRRR